MVRHSSGDRSFGKNGAAVVVELACERLPVICGNSRLGGGNCEAEEWWTNGASCHGLPSDQFTLALDAPAIARRERRRCARTRWQGMASAIGLAAQALATARGEARGPMRRASSA